MKDTRPLIMLDVDGVLRPWTRKPPAGFNVYPLGLDNVFLNPDHGPMLLKLAEDTGAELTWCSMWQTAANIFIGPKIGLPILPVVPIPPSSEIPVGVSLGAHKAMHAARYAGIRPLAWFDDESDAGYWMARMKKGPATVVCTDEMTGLTERHINAARKWLRNLSRSPHTSSFSS